MDWHRQCSFSRLTNKGCLQHVCRSRRRHSRHSRHSRYSRHTATADTAAASCLPASPSVHVVGSLASKLPSIMLYTYTVLLCNTSWSIYSIWYTHRHVGSPQILRLKTSGLVGKKHRRPTEDSRAVSHCKAKGQCKSASASCTFLWCWSEPQDSLAWHRRLFLSPKSEPHVFDISWLFSFYLCNRQVQQFVWTHLTTISHQMENVTIVALFANRTRKTMPIIDLALVLGHTCSRWPMLLHGYTRFVFAWVLGHTCSRWPSVSPDDISPDDICTDHVTIVALFANRTRKTMPIIDLALVLGHTCSRWPISGMWLMSAPCHRTVEWHWTTPGWFLR